MLKSRDFILSIQWRPEVWNSGTEAFVLFSFLFLYFYRIRFATIVTYFSTAICKSRDSRNVDLPGKMVLVAPQCYRKIQTRHLYHSSDCPEKTLLLFFFFQIVFAHCIKVFIFNVLLNLLCKIKAEILDNEIKFEHNLSTFLFNLSFFFLPGSKKFCISNIMK